MNDEEYINDLLKSSFHNTLSSLDDTQLEKYLIKKLENFHNDTTEIITLTSAPASGKSTLLDKLIKELISKKYKADYISTDDFLLYTREERNLLTANGSSPLEKYGCKYLNEVVLAVKNMKTILSPKYDELTGMSIAIGKENYPHIIPANLDFFIIEGDFQLISHPDMQIYLHLLTEVRRENRVIRDLQKRGESDIKKIKENFDKRLITQYYPYTLPQAQKADILIVIRSSEAPKDYLYRTKYTYDIYEKN